MLRPTKAQTNAQEENLVDGHLSSDDQKGIRVLVRQHTAYNSASYPDLDARLAAVEGFDAKQILASAELLDAAGQKHTSLELTGLVRRKKDVERVDWALVIMSILWDGVEPAQTMASGDVEGPACSPFCGCCGQVVCCCVHARYPG